MSKAKLPENLEEQIRSIVSDELNSQTNHIAESIPYSRRDILKGAAMLGTSAAVGGVGVYGAVGRAAAQSSEGSGSIGTAENPLDAIYVNELYQNTDNITADSISTDELNSIYSPEAGEDLANYWGDNTTILLRPNTDYNFSALPPASQATITSFGVGSVESAPHLTYTGSTGSTTDAIDWTGVGGGSVITGCVIEGCVIEADNVRHVINAEDFTNQSVLRDIRVQGTTNDAAIRVSRAFYSSLENVRVRGFGNVSGAGIKIDEQAGAVTEFKVDRATVDQCNRGIDIVDGRVNLMHPTLEGCDQEGLRFDGKKLVLTDPYFEQNGGAMTTPRHVEIQNGNVTITSGLYQGSGLTGGQQVHVAGGVNGSFRGGEFLSGDPDNHILNESTLFEIVGTPQVATTAAVQSVDTKGSLIGRPSNAEAPIRIDGERGYVAKPEDLSSLGFSFPGTLRVHNGDDGNPEGLYWYDGTNWVYTTDGSTTI